MRTCLGIPVAGGSVPAEAFTSHLNLAVEISRLGDIVLPSVVDIYPHDRAREAIVEATLENNCDFLFFADADVDIPTGAFARLHMTLVETKAQVISGYVIRRGYPYTSTWTKVHPQGNYPVNVEAKASHGPFEIDSSGMGCTLIDARWCKEFLGEKGWFQMGRIGQDPKVFVWEDAFFCKSVLEKGGKIIAEPRVRCGHYDSRMAINDSTADFLRGEYIRQRS